jgi:hypothetical protein
LLWIRAMEDLPRPQLSVREGILPGEKLLMQLIFG